MRGYSQAWILGLFACGILASCSRPKYIDNSTLTIIPGFGISNIVEIGMILPTIKKNTRDLAIQECPFQHISAFVVRIPSLGAFWEQNKKVNYVRDIEFVVNPSVYAKGSPFYSFPSFRGSIAGGLSFSKQQVKREDVVKVFGQPACNIDEHSISSDSIRDAWEQRRSLLANGQSVASRRSENTEVLYYPSQGIIFTLNSNVVYGVIIRKKELGPKVNYEGKGDRSSAKQ